MCARRRSSRSGPNPISLVLLLAVAVVAIVLWQCAPRPPLAPPATAPASIRIATWNLKQFSDTRKADLAMIARIIQESSFDLVAIQEVKGEGDEIDRLLNTLGAPWRSTSISPKTGGNYERFTFLYRSDRLGETARPALVNLPDFARKPYQGHFKSGAFEFSVLSVHLFYTDVAQRRREAEALARFARDMAANAPDKRLIIVGDFNEEKRRPNFGLFTAGGWRPLIADATNLSSRETYDNILIDPARTAEWTGRAGVVPFDELHFANDDKQAVRSVSDHRPAWADFSTAGR